MKKSDIMLSIGIIMSLFWFFYYVPGFAKKKSYEWWYQDMVKATISEQLSEVEFRIKSLEDYKKACMKKTQDQKEINNDHGSVIEYLRQTIPDLKPAIDLNEIKDKKAE